MLRENEIQRYEDKMIIELIRVKLGRYLKDKGLRFDFDARDDSYTNSKNKRISDIFEEYYNNYKIVCASYKGGMMFAVFNKSKYNKDLWDKLNNDFSDWNDEKYMKMKYSAEYTTSCDDLQGFTTTEIIFNIIRKCNSL